MAVAVTLQVPISETVAVKDTRGDSEAEVDIVTSDEIVPLRVTVTVAVVRAETEGDTEADPLKHAERLGSTEKDGEALSDKLGDRLAAVVLDATPVTLARTENDRPDDGERLPETLRDAVTDGDPDIVDEVLERSLLRAVSLKVAPGVCVSVTASPVADVAIVDDGDSECEVDEETAPEIDSVPLLEAELAIDDVSDANADAEPECDKVTLEERVADAEGETDSSGVVEDDAPDDFDDDGVISELDERETDAVSERSALGDAPELLEPTGETLARPVRVEMTDVEEETDIDGEEDGSDDTDADTDAVVDNDASTEPVCVTVADDDRIAE